MLKFVPDVLPEFIPEDAAPLESVEDLSPTQLICYNAFAALKNKNIYVELNDGRTYTGLLNGIRGFDFYVGTKSPKLKYVDVKKYRVT